MKIQALQFNKNRSNFSKKEEHYAKNNINTNSFLEFDNYIGILNKNLINFRGIQDFKSKLEEKITTTEQDEILEFLYYEFRKRAEEKRIYFQIAEDVIQNAMLNIAQLSEQYLNEEISQEKLIDSINTLYINLSEQKSDSMITLHAVSLDKKLNSTDDSFLNILTDEDEYRTRYSRPATDEERKKNRIKINKLIARSSLTPGENMILSDRYSEDNLISYEKLSDKHNLSINHIRNVIKAAIYKIQAKHNAIPENIKVFIQNFSKRFDISQAETKEMLKRHIGLLDEPLDKAEYNTDTICEYLSKDGISKKEYIKACVNQPELFCYSPDRVIFNIETLTARFLNNDFDRKKFLSSLLTQPSILCRDPKAIIDNVEGMVAKFRDYGLDEKSYIKSCIKYPSLFERLPDLLEENINQTVKNFEKDGLTKEKYISCCIKQPSLFYHPAEKIKYNVEDFVEEFEDEGLTSDGYIGSCIKQPSLFCRNPKNQSKNIREIAASFKTNGLSTKDYIKACLKQPAMFYLPKETMCEHIDIIRFTEFNKNHKIDTDKFWSKILNHPIDITYSSSLLLIENLIIPKMFENSKVPKELKGTRLRQKLYDYLQNNPNEKYKLNIKLIDSNTDILKILNETLSQISKEALSKDDIFEINIIE